MAYIDYDDYCIYYGPGDTIHNGELFPYPDPPYYVPYEIKYGPTSAVISSLYAKNIVPENYLLKITSFDDEHYYLGSWSTRGYSCFTFSGNDPIDVPIFNAGLVPLDDTFVGGYEGSLSYSGNFGSYRQWKIGIQRIREISLPAGGYRVWQDLGAIYFVELLSDPTPSINIDVWCVDVENAYMRFSVDIVNPINTGLMLPITITSSDDTIVEGGIFYEYIGPLENTTLYYDLPILRYSESSVDFNVSSTAFTSTWNFTVYNCIRKPCDYCKTNYYYEIIE